MKKLLTILALTILFSSCEKLEMADPLDKYTYNVSSNECIIQYALGSKKTVDIHSDNGVFAWSKDFAADDVFIPYLSVVSKTTTDSITVEIVKNKEIIYTNKY